MDDESTEKKDATEAIEDVDDDVQEMRTGEPMRSLIVSGAKTGRYFTVVVYEYDRASGKSTKVVRRSKSLRIEPIDQEHAPQLEELAKAVFGAVTQIVRTGMPGAAGRRLQLSESAGTEDFVRELKALLERFS